MTCRLIRCWAGVNFPESAVKPLSLGRGYKALSGNPVSGSGAKLYTWGTEQLFGNLPAPVSPG